MAITHCNQITFIKEEEEKIYKRVRLGCHPDCDVMMLCYEGGSGPTWGAWALPAGWGSAGSGRPGAERLARVESSTAGSPAGFLCNRHIHMHMHIRRGTHTHTHAHIHAGMHAHTHAQRHTHTPTHTQKHAHIQTHTHKHIIDFYVLINGKNWPWSAPMNTDEPIWNVQSVWAWWRTSHACCMLRLFSVSNSKPTLITPWDVRVL